MTLTFLVWALQNGKGRAEHLDWERKLAMMSIREKEKLTFPKAWLVLSSKLKMLLHLGSYHSPEKRVRALLFCRRES